MTSLLTPLLWTLPWVVPPVVALLRSRNSRSLDDVAAEVVAPAPLVSVVIPARNERRNIERCVRSIMESDYKQLEIIVVNDHSTDGTGDVARAMAALDRRVQAVDAAELPEGWFGKQWACATGASFAHGRIVVFTDADTWHSRDLIPRVVNAIRDDEADLLTVAGHQEMHSFWERVIQPHVFALLLVRYGGTEYVSRAKRSEDVIANGQFIAMRRDAYDAMGGHALVRDRVAEDMALGQEFHRAGRRVVMLLAMNQLSTHMYASLREVIAGWQKNIYAAGRTAALGGAAGRATYPVFLLGIPLIGLAPPVALVLSVFSVLSHAWLVWSAICVTVALGFWSVLYHFMKVSTRYAALYPLGLVMLTYIAITAVMRGHKVEWKEREYLSAKG